MTNPDDALHPLPPAAAPAASASPAEPAAAPLSAAKEAAAFVAKIFAEPVAEAPAQEAQPLAETQALAPAFAVKRLRQRQLAGAAVVVAALATAVAVVGHGGADIAVAVGLARRGADALGLGARGGGLGGGTVGRRRGTRFGGGLGTHDLGFFLLAQLGFVVGMHFHIAYRKFDVVFLETVQTRPGRDRQKFTIDAQMGVALVLGPASQLGVQAFAIDHQRREQAHAAVSDTRFQDLLLAELARATGTTLA